MMDLVTVHADSLQGDVQGGEDGRFDRSQVDS